MVGGDMDLRRLGQRIREQREKRKLKQSDIASALRVSAQAVSKWERGENAPDIALLVDLARLLGVSVDWILGGEVVETDTFPAAVFCTGLNGFAERAASMSPKELAAWANVIYYAITESLLEAEGVPIKYVGDGFLGFVTGAGCCERALEAAVSAKQRLATPDFVTVINYGDIYLGTIGHPDYAMPDILGETVNTAFLVMPWVATNAQTGMGITDLAYETMDASNDLERCGEVAIPGRTSPVAIYERRDLT
jgi:transcriptional regulator with XRE-family HTH domain